MIHRTAGFVVILAATSLSACAHVRVHANSDPPGKYVAPAVRMAAIRHAQVWEATDVPSMNLMKGPAGPGAFEPEATVTCNYIEKKMNGNTPKFTCVIPPEDEVKVKYGRGNGEVYAEVAASRLLWALGFQAERMYPVRVICHGCPSNIKDTEMASIQRKLSGKNIETSDGSGWTWPELDRVNPAEGGAPRSQRDALKLLAVFVQHTDSKPEQQRLVCVDEGATREGAAACAKTVMLMHDTGKTFGHANAFNRDRVSAVNIREWSRTPIWKDPARCVARLPKSLTGTLDDPRISEDGRKFLADLLVQLTDTQLHDLFTVARFPERGPSSHGVAKGTTVDQWVNEFKQKRDEIVNHSCPGQ